MQIVINIPEELYNHLKKRPLFSSDVSAIVYGIKNGTPLPKGHGELTDKKEVEKMIEEAKVDSEHSKTFAENIIKFAPTIIPTDNLHWIDNADSYICPICGLEVHSPSKYEGCKCPKCGFQDEKDKEAEE